MNAELNMRGWIARIDITHNHALERTVNSPRNHRRLRAAAQRER